ncbi:MAG: VOC family protein [Sphingomonas sp.]|nr:VOC family protein [Sphingomonas sp.]
MFSHIMVGANDLEKSRAFYDATLGVFGAKPGFQNGNRWFWRHNGGTFSISIPINGDEACHGNGATVGFNAETPELADAWHAAGLAAGGTTCEDPPGWREGAMGKLYLAYLRDPDGNKLCALHRPAA